MESLLIKQLGEGLSHAVVLTNNGQIILREIECASLISGIFLINSLCANALIIQCMS